MRFVPYEYQRYCTESVSYTHLDVYKRQDHDRSDTVFKQCTEKVRTGIRKWHGASTPFVKI